ncbi:MAG: PorT family protein [Saprospiraceae bacterium]|nr:PorT family protein [Saprospiraceae bacterium]
MKNTVILFLLSLTIGLQGQTPRKVDFNKDQISKFDKKLLIGFAFNNSWTSFPGMKGHDVFTKPSLGFHVKTDYFFKKNIGISVGLGYQQRGCGIINIDVEKSVGNADSTHRQRFRTNNISIPLQLIFRQQHYIFKDAKLSFGIGIVPSYIFSATDIFHSVEDGFHILTHNTDDYNSFDIPVRLSAGIDVNASESCIFRIHLVADFGLTNMYIDPADQTTSGRNRLYGIDLNCMF